MGLFKRTSWSSFDSKPCAPAQSQPNPSNYTILDSAQIGNYLIVKLKYPDCTNYEGKKILLFENCTILSLVQQSKIDPHFSTNKCYHSPIARFEPTTRGWQMAIELATINNLRKR